MRSSGVQLGDVASKRAGVSVNDLTDEKTLEQLARDIARKQAKVWSEQSDSLIDRAWKSIVSSLKQFTGKGARLCKGNLRVEA